MKLHKITVDDNGTEEVLQVWADDHMDAIYKLILEHTGMQVRIIHQLNAKELFDES